MVTTVAPPFAEKTMRMQSEPDVELACRLPVWSIFTLLSLSLAMILICCLLALKTRHLPENYNESWFIFVSVCATLFLWLAFFPTYFVTFYASFKAMLLALVLIMNASIFLLCFFAPKLYALYFVASSDLTYTSHKIISSSTSAVIPTQA